jgi:protein-tyrosine phosphatase
MLLSSLALAASPPAFAQQTNAGLSFSANAERIGPALLRVQWSGVRAPVQVLVSPSPDAPEGMMRVLAENAQSNSLDVALPATPRPYFMIVAKDGKSVRVGERLLPLEGGRNFRDLGGYQAQSGQTVRWGRIFRSGVMTGLTANDLIYLDRLGIETICDLRSLGERREEPAPFAQPTGPMIAAFDYDMDMSGMAAMFTARTREEAVAAFAASYAGMTQMLRTHFTDLFARLTRDEGPLAFNCSAGKDRTGLASALILSVLGVPRDVVIADYALSETFVPPQKYIDEIRNPKAESVMTPEQRALFTRMPDAVLRVLMGTDADVMRLTLSAFDRDFGGPVALAKAQFGLTDAHINALRSTYLV